MLQGLRRPVSLTRGIASLLPKNAGTRLYQRARKAYASSTGWPRVGDVTRAARSLLSPRKRPWQPPVWGRCAPGHQDAKSIPAWRGMQPQARV